MEVNRYQAAQFLIYAFGYKAIGATQNDEVVVPYSPELIALATGVIGEYPQGYLSQITPENELGHKTAKLLRAVADYLMPQPEDTQSPTWQPIETAPRDGSYVLVAGKSGYSSTPLRVEVCRWEHDGWRNHAHDWFTDGGEESHLWAPLPKAPS
jgi:hypothetical protein